MAVSRIPDEIRSHRPGPCTEVKLISGHYYVYMYHSVKLKSGRWGKKTGKCIGRIVPEQGFIPNRNYHLYEGTSSQDDISILEYGQYALIESIANDVKAALERHFPIDRASQIFACASILYANNFVHIDQIKTYYEQSWLSQEYAAFPLNMGKTAIGTLLDDLGRRTARVENYENEAVSESSKFIAVDGHAIRSCSEENDLGEAGYRFNALKEDQANLLMGYDIEKETPLFSRIYRGSCNDKSTMDDLFGFIEFSGVLFVVDRGFYSEKNIRLFSQNGNRYIIPVPSGTTVFKDAIRDVNYTDSFYYRAGKKHSRIEYQVNKISDTEYVAVYRDVDENEKCRFNYQHNIDLGKSGYTQEKLETNKEFFGVYILRYNDMEGAEHAFMSFKKRWGIETFYQYLKNRGDFNNLMIQDYYKEQGMAFMMLVTGQIHQKMISAVKSVNDNTLSVYDVLLKARCLKMKRKGNNWYLENGRKKDLELFSMMGFEPQYTVEDLS